SGGVTLAGGGTGTGAFIVAPSTGLIVTGAYYLEAGTTVAGPGQVGVTGALIVNAPVSVANFNLAGGSVRGTGALTWTGSAAWSGGEMLGTGTTPVAAGVTLTISGSAGVEDQRTLEVAGTVNQTSDLGFGPATALTIRPGGIYNLSNSIFAGIAL